MMGTAARQGLVFVLAAGICVVGPPARSAHGVPPGDCLGIPVTVAGATDGDDNLVGTDGDDVIHLGDGNDTFDGKNGDDLICGGIGNDTLNGGEGNDTLVGGPGDDTLDGKGPSASSFSGGIDEADYSTAAGPITADASGPDNSGSATGEGTDTLASIEALRGSPFADDLTAERVNGGPGDDTLDATQLDYSDAPAGVVVDVTTLPGTATGGAGSDTIDTGRFSEYVEEVVRSTAFADTVTGFTAADFLLGFGFVDPLVVIPGDGNDTITAHRVDYSGFATSVDRFRDQEPAGRPGDFAGAPGPVTIDLAAGTVTGAWGSDALTGVDDASGSRFDDTITGNANRNSLHGHDGDDNVTGGDEGDFLVGGPGNDTIDGGPGDDFVNGDGRLLPDPPGPVAPTAFPANTIHIVKDARPDGPTTFDFNGTGGIGAFTLDNNDPDATHPDQISFGGLATPASYDITETVPAGWRLSSITCVAALGSTTNVDLAAATVTVDLAAGDAVVCRFVDERADDTITAGPGDDVIEPRFGDDSVDGGTGNNLVRFQNDAGTVADTFDPGGGVVVDLLAGTVTGQGTDALAVGTVQEVIGTRYADTLRGDAADNRFMPLDGDDLVDGRDGTDEADFGLDPQSGHGRGGADFFPGDPPVTVDLAAGTATGASHGTDTLTSIEDATGGFGDDTLRGTTGPNVLIGRTGNDTLEGREGDDTLDGGFNDFGPAAGDTASYAGAPGPVIADLEAGTATGAGASDDVLIGIENLIGGPFGDTLLGGPANNRLDGLGGDDFLDGRFGIDAMDGGAATDECVVTSGLEAFEVTISCETVSTGPPPPAGTTDVTEVGPNDFRISTMGPLNDGNFGIPLTGFTERSALAYNSVDNQFLVAWIADDVVDDEFRIFGQLLDASGAEIGPDDFLIGDVGSGPADLFAGLAAAYNPDRNEYLVAWTGDPTGDYEIHVQRLTAAGAEIGGDDVQISSVADFFTAEGIDVVYNPNSQEYLVAWVSDDATPTPPMVDGEAEVLAQRLTGLGAEIGPDDFRISDVNGIGLAPDSSIFGVALAHDSAANQYLAIWTARDDDTALESLVYGQLVDAAGAETGPNDFVVRDMAGGFGQNADVAYSAGQNEFLVVFEGTLTTTFPFDFDIFGQRVSPAGAPAGALIQISDMGTPGDPDAYALRPSVAYDGANDRYLVVWEGREPPLADAAPGENFANCLVDECEIFGQWLTANPTQIGPDDVRITDMGADGDPAFDARFPQVAYNSTDNEWLVTFPGNDYPLAQGENEMYGQRLRFPGTIRIVKDSVPDDPQDAGFVFNGPVSGSFVLDDDADPTLSNTQQLTDVPEGVYTITETVPAGWTLTSIVCDDPTAVIDLATASVMIDLSLGEVVTCTFTDVQGTVPTDPTTTATTSTTTTTTTTTPPTGTTAPPTSPTTVPPSGTTIPVTQTTLPPATAAPTTPPPTPFPGGLPATGSEPLPVLNIALASLLLGVALTAATRRRMS